MGHGSTSQAITKLEGGIQLQLTSTTEFPKKPYHKSAALESPKKRPPVPPDLRTETVISFNNLDLDYNLDHICFF